MKQSEHCWKDENKTLHLTCERCEAEDEFLFEAPADPCRVHDYDPFWRYDTDWIFCQDDVICPNCQTTVDRNVAQDVCAKCGDEDPYSIIEDEFGKELELCDRCYDRHWTAFTLVYGADAAHAEVARLYAKWWKPAIEAKGRSAVAGELDRLGFEQGQITEILAAVADPHGT